MDSMRCMVIGAMLISFLAGCTTYSQAVVDTNYDLVYITYAKSFMGMNTRSGVLTCVPTRENLQCVDKLVVGSSIPSTSDMSDTAFACSSNSTMDKAESSTQRTMQRPEATASPTKKVEPAVLPPPPERAQKVSPPPTSQSAAASSAVIRIELGSLSNIVANEDRLSGCYGKRVKIDLLAGGQIEGVLSGHQGGSLVIQRPQGQWVGDMTSMSSLTCQ